MRKRGKLLISSTFLEVALMVLGILAFAFIIGDGIGVVSGTTTKTIVPAKGPAIKVNLQKFAGKTYGGLQEGQGLDFQLTDGGWKEWDGKGWTKEPSKKALSALESAEGASAEGASAKTPKGLGGHLGEGLVWSFYALIVIQMVGGIAGWDQEETKAYSTAVVSGIMAGKFAYGLAQEYGWGSEGGFLGMDDVTPGQGWSATIGVVTVALVLYATYRKEKERTATFQCKVWQPEQGGARCEECNNDPWRPCTEYRCRSLGSTCEVVNPGTEKEMCVNINPKDVNSPTIEPWLEVLKPTDLKYSNVNLRPPSLGMQIVRGEEGCLKAYTPLEFGLTTNEPAYCKVSYNRTSKFEDMQFDFGETNFYLYNHTHKMLLPSPNDEDYDLGPILQNDGTFTLFVRCEDKNGNSNVDEFAINFCVDPSPDTTAPIITGTSITSGSPVQFGIGNAIVGVFVNEPAECKWGRESSKNFNEMENTMQCSNNPIQLNADMSFVCLANFTGIQDRQENKYYLRCKDQPNKEENVRNVMVQSYELILRGSQPLNILKHGPNGTISGNTNVVSIDLTATTDDGADEGEAICFFSSSEVNETFVEFFETRAVQHRQNLELSAGSYRYYIRCIDAGGNADEKFTDFNVQVDREAPVIARAYRDNGLKVVTNEDAECVYSLSDCNYVFGEGLPMAYSNPSIRTSHFAEWRAGATYYIKCKDEFGNEPMPNACSLEISTFELG